MKKLFMYSWLLGLLAPIAHAQVVFTSMPIEGTNGASFFIVNHVDHDTSGGLQDFACGDKTYNGHQGTDFLIRSFKTMDSGVNVKAVASGRVFFVSDTQYDRNKHTNSLGFGNYIGINHQNTLYTYYAHIKKHSALVHVGDSVVAGQVIAQVGSSGNCTDPHVHLEVYDYYSNVIDPFSGTCQTTSSSVWAAQPYYDTSLKIIDKGFTPYVPNLDTLRERFLVRDTFYYGVDTTINFWLQIQGVRLNDTEKFEWFTPSGALWFSYSSVAPRNWWYYYNWSYINVPDTFGWWHARYSVNGVARANKPFFVTTPTGIPEVTTQHPRPVVSPNPARDLIFVSGLAESETLIITDIMGKELLRVGAKERQLTISFLPKGLYILRCGDWTGRLLKE